MDNLIIKKHHKNPEQRPSSRSSVTSLKIKDKKIQQNKDFLEYPNNVGLIQKPKSYILLQYL
jgi:hypothetical protein